MLKMKILILNPLGDCFTANGTLLGRLQHYEQSSDGSSDV